MATNQFKDRTIKDIFEALLGRENAKNVLTKIQDEFDKGVTEKTFIEFVRRTINEIPDLKNESVKLAVFVIKLSMPTHLLP
jgi:hypothetical protein